MPGTVNYTTQNGHNTISYFGSIVKKRAMKLQDNVQHQFDAPIVWLDKSMNPKNCRTRKLLKQMNDQVELFTAIDECQNYLCDQKESLLLIISGSCARLCLPSIHSYPCIDSIIIYCARPENYQDFLSDSYPKVLDCITLEEILVYAVHQWVAFKCQMQFHTWNKQISHQRIKIELMAWFLIEDILVDLTKSFARNEAKRNFLNYCRERYSSDPTIMKMIEQFEQTYIPSQAIQWYTSQTFVYKLVNRALRSLDITQHRRLAFFISDLRQQLHEQQLTSLSVEKSMRVYWGVTMNQSAIEQSSTVAGETLLIPRGFLTASTDHPPAKDFIRKENETSDSPVHHILFVISLNLDQSPITCINVSHDSNRTEILFDLDAVFSVTETTYDDDSQRWIVQLVPATYDDCQSIQRVVQTNQSRYVMGNTTYSKIDLFHQLLGQRKGCEPDLSNHKESTWNKISVELKKPKRFVDNFKESFKSFTKPNNDHIYSQTSTLNTRVTRRTFAHCVVDGSQQCQTLSNIGVCPLVRERLCEMNKREPIFYFRLNTADFSDEESKLNTMFSEQYRRFIVEHVDQEEMRKNLDEYHSIIYVSSELPSYMEDNSRIVFYPLNLSSEEPSKDPFWNSKIIERLINRLLLDLGEFYTKQAISFPQDVTNKPMTKCFLEKASRCYKLMKNEIEKSIQRHKQNN